MASKFSRSTNLPPNRSASVTTPTGSDVQAAMQLCTSSRSDSERRHGRASRVEVEPDQLGAAAADIEHQRAVAIAVDQRGAARDSELGLGLAARRSRCRGRCRGARGRGTRRRWRRAGRPRWRSGRERDTLSPPHLAGADLQRIDGALMAGSDRWPDREHAFAQANDAGESIDDLESRGARVAPPTAGNCWCRGRAPRKPELPRAGRVPPHRSCPGLPPIGPRPAHQAALGPRLMPGRHPRSRWSRSARPLGPAKLWQPCGHCRSAQSRCSALMSAAPAYFRLPHAWPRQWFDNSTVARS